MAFPVADYIDFLFQFPDHLPSVLLLVLFTFKCARNTVKLNTIRYKVLISMPFEMSFSVSFG